MPDFEITFLSVSQVDHGRPTCKVKIIFQVLGPKSSIDVVQVYAVNAAHGGPQGLGDLVDTVDLDIINYQYVSVVDLEAGAAYTLALCPRSVTGGVPDDKIDDQYWETFCVYESFTTRVDLPKTGRPRPPVITDLKFNPATLQDDASIKVTWEADATAMYQSFLISWNEGGHSRAQGEADYQSPTTTGSWTATQVFPREVYTFAVNGGTYGGIQGYNYYDWGPTVKIVAPSNLTSLRQFLSISGINPAGASLRALMVVRIVYQGLPASLREFMKLT
jgi:hypothetical protein